MLIPLLVMVLAWKLFYVANLLTRSRNRLVEQDQRKRWVAAALAREAD